MQQRNSAGAPVQHIVICGSGLAAQMTAAALTRQIPATIRITLVQLGDTADTDLFYGTVAGPTAYAFNLSAGLEEPQLVRSSSTAFCWGTKYDHWADGKRSWIQSFQLPLPVIDGVLFHHYLAQQGQERLEPFLVSAVAARSGAFVHPPRNANNAGQQLLSRAEYGYQLDPSDYGRLFDGCTDKSRIRIVDGTSAQIDRSEAGIAAVRLSGGERIEGDLYLDCTGPDALLLSRLDAHLAGSRRLGAAMSQSPASQLGPPLRTVAPASFGWRSETPLRGRNLRLTIFDPQSKEEAFQSHVDGIERSSEITLGRRSAAWSGNCVGIGQAAYVVEPLTIAPLLLLERDIERLMELIPFSTDMSVERQEYNRRCAADHEHSELFTQALFQTAGLPATPYWEAARSAEVPEKLSRKIDLFRSRGVLVSYDLEPFHSEDWTILHYGMGRRPDRHDRIADRAPPERVRSFLGGMKSDIERLVAGLPPHATYMSELERYLMQKPR